MLGLVVKALGRGTAWRLSRRLYMHARGDIPNTIATNGEIVLVRGAVERKRQEGTRDAFVVLDVGANLGTYSKEVIKASAIAGLNLNLTAFEPAPKTFECLKVSLPATTHVRLENMALSSRPGTASMQITGETAGTNTLSPGHELGQTTEVRMGTLCEYVASRGISQIDLLKIDTEGHDLEVLRGGLDLFRDGRIAVAQFEYNHRWLFANASLYQLFVLFAGLPYKIGRVTPRGVEFFEAWSFEMDRFFESNYAIVRDDAVRWIPHVLGRLNRNNVYERMAVGVL